MELCKRLLNAGRNRPTKARGCTPRDKERRFRNSKGNSRHRFESMGVHASCRIVVPTGWTRGIICRERANLSSASITEFRQVASEERRTLAQPAGRNWQRSCDVVVINPVAHESFVASIYPAIEHAKRGTRGTKVCTEDSKINLKYRGEKFDVSRENLSLASCVSFLDKRCSLCSRVGTLLWKRKKFFMHDLEFRNSRHAPRSFDMNDSIV